MQCGSILMWLKHTQFLFVCLLDVHWNKTKDVTVMCLQECLNERMTTQRVIECMS